MGRPSFGDVDHTFHIPSLEYLPAVEAMVISLLLVLDNLIVSSLIIPQTQQQKISSLARITPASAAFDRSNCYHLLCRVQLKRKPLCCVGYIRPRWIIATICYAALDSYCCSML